MAGRYRATYLTPEVRSAQERFYGRSPVLPPQPERDPIGDEEAAFIARRDSFYLASVNSEGWPYVQHRGGPPGFLRVADPHTLAFADYKGNRQLLTTGHVAHNPRVALFLMDYPQRERLKILGHARIEDARAHPELVARWASPGLARDTERIVFIDVLSFDWNCPSHITPRFTEAELEPVLFPLKSRIAQLEAELAAARGPKPG